MIYKNTIFTSSSTISNLTTTFTETIIPEDNTLLLQFSHSNTSGYVPFSKIDLELEYEELPTLLASNGRANIYCYSFAIHPEELQPSGVCNFSRIKQAHLEFDNNIGESTANLKIFATNYNILTIESGKAGLRFNYF